LRIFVSVTLLLGVALLVAVLRATDLTEVATRLEQMGPFAIAAVLASYGLGYVFRAIAWQITLPSLRFTPRSLRRAFQITMTSCALDHVTPLGGLGGEPVKAVMLKREFGIRYRDATASLVLSRTTDVMAQVIFIAVGIAILFRMESIPRAVRLGAAAGLCGFALAVALFFVAQRLRALGLVRRLAGRLGSRVGERALGALAALQDVEEGLVTFYRDHRGRFSLSLAASLCEWMTGAVAAWVALGALGQPVGWGDATAIEAFVVLVRSSLFFVPADLGTQEAALVLICGAVTGSPAAGLALAAVRRGADLVWVVWGLAVGSVWSLTDAAAPDPADPHGTLPPDRG